MEIRIITQIQGLCCFAALGLALGLFYDILRPMRYFKNRNFIWDLVFCTVSAAACFVLSMNRGNAHIWELASALLFFCLYINYFSPFLLPLFLAAFKSLLRFCLYILQSWKKLQIFVKKIFTKCPD